MAYLRKGNNRTKTVLSSHLKKHGLHLKMYMFVN